jgi:hypothetical protein
MELRSSLLQNKLYDSEEFPYPSLGNNKTMPSMQPKQYLELLRPRRNSMDDQREKTGFSQPLQP